MEEIDVHWEPRKVIIGSVTLAGTLLALLAIVYFSPLQKYLQSDQLDYWRNYFHSWSYGAPIIFAIFASAAIGIGVPRTLVSFIAGGVFGLVTGVILAEIASIVGTIFLFLYVRWFRTNFFPKELGSKRFAKIDKYASENGFLITLVIRQLPIPSLAITSTLAITKISFWSFIFSSAISFLPLTIVFCLYGSGAHGNFMLRATIASLLMIAFALGITYFLKNSQKAQEIIHNVESNRESNE